MRKKLSDEERRQRRRESYARYDASEKGKVRQKRHDASEKGKVRQKRYDASEKGKATRKAYNASEEGKARRKRYEASEKCKAAKKRYRESDKGKAAKKAGAKRYNASEKGKAANRRNRSNRRARKANAPGLLTVTLGELCRFFGSPLCIWCGVNPATDVDHLKALASDDPSNYNEHAVPACGSCNPSRGKRDPIPWLIQRQADGKPIGPLAWEIGSGKIGYQPPQLQLFNPIEEAT